MNEKSLIGSILSERAPAIAMLEDGNLIFISPDQASDVLLMGKQNQKRDRYGKYPVQGVVDIKNHQNKDGECNAGENGTQGNKSGQVKHQEKNPHARDRRPWGNAKYHPE
jgi:hypothetical protein